MQKVRFLLINPTAPVWQVHRGGQPRVPRVFRFSMLPSLYVAAAMPPYVETQIIDEDVEPIPYDTDADLVGLSFMTFNAPRAYAIADRYREQGKPVIFGGYHPTFMPDEAIRHADALCIGEAENNVPRMMKDFVAGHLQPFYESAPVDLGGLPPLDRSLIRTSAYIADFIQASRGCPYRCNFCSIAAFNRYKFRARPVDEVIAELKTLGRTVIFIDDNILGNRDYAKELFAAMIPLNKRWFTQCSIAIADDHELLRLAAASGCRGMFIGFESLSQGNLVASNKRVNRAKNYSRVVKKLHAAGIAVFAGFVFGMDEDTPDVFGRTLEFLLDAQLDALQATSLTPFPGTPLYDEMERQGRVIDRDWQKYDFGHVVFEPLHMRPETLERGIAWVLRQFYARKAITRRARQALGYLGLSAGWHGMMLVNLGYRRRFRMNGTFEKARPYEQIS